MELTLVDAALLKKMFLAGAKRIESKKEYINELNVFPVPDGDTGTNMTLTILSAAREVAKLDDPTFATLAKAISSGSLRGARGNSGVILSQLLRGFCKIIGEADQIDVLVLAEACEKAVETAYKAVMKPKEGTILTVARAGAEKATEICDDVTDLVEFGKQVIDAMQIALENTPELLPVLKEAGVVDSGGQGLIEILLGVKDAYLGQEIPFDTVIETKGGSAPVGAANDNISTADIKFGYCTEFIILLEKEFLMPQELEFKAFLESIGDSIVCVAMDDIVKVHVHTNDPGLAIQKALTFGQLTSMKIDNMREEHNERVIMSSDKQAEKTAEPKKDEPKKKYGFITVSIGDGMNEIFRGLGADYIIEGGQTMNPSTEDMLNAIDAVNAENIFILPNNSNIILAASQARDLTEDKNIIVMPTKTIPQGIACLINFMDSEEPEDNEEAMKEGISLVKTAQITYAVRDTSIDGHEIHVDDIMGIADKGIVAVGNEINHTALDTVKALIDEDSEIVSIYYGADMTEEDAEDLKEKIEAEFDYVDIEVHNAGQPVYYYVISVE